MSAPRVIVRYFNEGSSTGWNDLAAVCAWSLADHCPAWDRDVQEIRPREFASPRGVQGNVHNTYKLDAWVESALASPDDAAILFLDADTLVRRPLDDVWDHAFDLAYTTKIHGSRYPFNGGVVFVRMSPRVRTFLETWRAVNRWFIDQPRDHEVWIPGFGGINQSAFGMLLTQPDVAWPDRFKGYRHGLSILRLPCVEWNCEDEHWHAFDANRTRIVHYKSALRRAVLGHRPDVPVSAALVKEWLAVKAATLRPREDPIVDRPDRTTQVTPDELTHRPEIVPATTIDEPNDEPRTENPKPLKPKQQRKRPAQHVGGV